MSTKVYVITYQTIDEGWNYPVGPVFRFRGHAVAWIRASAEEQMNEADLSYEEDGYTIDDRLGDEFGDAGNGQPFLAIINSSGDAVDEWILHEMDIL